ncbi:MAG: pilus assembly protein [Sulfuricaulis sp.]
MNRRNDTSVTCYAALLSSSIHNDKHKTRRRQAWFRTMSLIALGTTLVGLTPSAFATQLTLSTVPLFLTETSIPNVLVVLDNSESMDGTMAGKLIAGNDPTTRSNVGRAAMLATIDSYSAAFNWGLMSFAYSNTPALYNTYAYYMGTSSSMYFTTSSDCSTGVSALYGTRCIANPQPFTITNPHPSTTYSYVTYASTGDDPSINDVLYTTGVYAQLWGLAAGGTNYKVYKSHNSVNSWSSSSFTGSQGTWGFTPTDSGFLPSSPSVTTQLWIPRAWGYLNTVTGGGKIYEPVLPSSTSGHLQNLSDYLQPETNSATPATGHTQLEIKDAAVNTPTVGTLDNAQTYFESNFSGNTSPITDTCQKNFVILVTDGLPTAKADGSLYSYPSETTPSFNSVTGQWNAAVQDVINQIKAMRSTMHGSTKYDIQTYVVALGDTVQNASAIAAMNAMALAGGTGLAYQAVDVQSFEDAMASVTLDIQAKTASASAVAVNSQVLTNNSRTYQARFTSGTWSGQLLAFPISSTGTIGSQLWDAGAVLQSQNWDTGRQIITWNGSPGQSFQGVPFRWSTNGLTALLASQQTVLNTNPQSNAVDGLGQARLNYLRGDCSNEGAGDNFRLRTIPNVSPAPPCKFKLGDIANSAPMYVWGSGSGTIGSWPDSIEPSSPYSAFRAQYSSRPPMIYDGANDGMLHGFADADGSEKIAYVPNIAFANLNTLTDPLYTHHYFVDASPTAADVYGVFADGISGCKTSGCWRTVLADGLAGGGKGIFALDVTDPTGIGSGPAFSEANASAIAMWEFTDSTTTTPGTDMGYVFGQASIVKMHSTISNPTGDWAVVFGNGYDSVNENAVLYVVSITNGALIAKIPLIPSGYSATGNSNGLSSPYVLLNSSSMIADYIYAGDLRGNMWKIDVTNSNPANWGASYTSGSKPAPLFIATDSDTNGGNPQPITERPAVGSPPSGQTGQMVYFGTGRYIAVSDNVGTATPTQTLYGIWDSNPASGAVTGAAVIRSNLLTQVISTATVSSTTVRGLTANTITSWGNNGVCNPGGAVCMGWKEDLLTGQTATLGEMSVFSPVVVGGTLPRVIFTTLIPESTACSAGGTSWLMEVDPYSGGTLSSAVLDINGDGVITSADEINGTTPVAGIQSTIGILPTPVIEQNSGNGNQTKIVSGSTGSIESIGQLPPPGPSPTNTGAQSWIQLR